MSFGRFVLLAGLVATAAFVGCGRTERRAASGGDWPPRSWRSSEKTRREFQDAVAKRLDQLEDKLEELRRRASSAAAERRPKLDRLASDLRRETDEAAAKLRSLSASAAEKWDELREQIDRAVADVERRVSDALR